MNPPTPARRFSLAQQHAALLALAFILFELLIAAVVATFVMFPMARRSADDLANLMILSAQTWSELPPETRVDYELELARTYQLALRAETPLTGASGRDEWHSPYLYFLEAALDRKTGQAAHLSHETVGDSGWYWRSLRSGDGFLSVGFREQRIGAQPFVAFAVSGAIGLILALLTALWLARRSVVPLARLEAAARLVGHGEIPALVPETGPRELAALASQFNRMANQVAELLSSRTTLLAGVSHDLRTPMARMRLALALLSEQPTPRLIARLEADIEEMDGLIARVLDLARDLRPEAVSEIDLSGMLHDLVAGMPPDKLRVTAVPDGYKFMASPSALRRVVGNLVDNALRYAGPAQVELCAEVRDESVSIGILDRGPGIPADQLHAVFQPFHRVETSRNRLTGGAGLGLAIVRQLADTHGWAISIAPRTGGGLEAWVQIPVK